MKKNAPEIPTLLIPSFHAASSARDFVTKGKLDHDNLHYLPYGQIMHCRRYSDDLTAVRALEMAGSSREWYVPMPFPKFREYLQQQGYIMPTPEELAAFTKAEPAPQKKPARLNNIKPAF